MWLRFFVGELAFCLLKAADMITGKVYPKKWSLRWLKIKRDLASMRAFFFNYCPFSNCTLLWLGTIDKVARLFYSNSF